MLVSYKTLVEITNRTTEILGEKFVLVPVLHHKTHIDWPSIELGPS